MKINFGGLMKSEFYKYRKSITYPATYLAMIVYGMVFAAIFPLLDDDVEAGTCILNILSNSVFMNMLISMLIVPFVINDFQHKTIQHTLTLGAGRDMIINAKLLLVSATCACAYIFAVVFGGICAVVLSSKGFVEISAGFVIQAAIAELVFIVVFVMLCMLFYIIVRSSAAYVMTIFVLWLSMLGSLAGGTFKNPIVNFLLKYNMFGQNQLMICQRMGTQVYYYTASDWVKYLLVMGITGVLLYVLIRAVFNKIEVR